MSNKLIIFNPRADHGRGARRLAALRALTESIDGLTWRGTEYPGHAAELAAQAAAEGFETVVAVGGDGTTHGVVNGLMRIDAGRRPCLAVVPAGNGNDFAGSAGVLMNSQQAMQRVFNGEPHPVDVGLIRDDKGRCEYFCNAAGVGFDAAVNLRSRRLQYLQGIFMYGAALLQTIIANFDAIPMRIEYDGSVIEEPLHGVIIGNGRREAGGLKVTPTAQVADGKLDVLCFRRMSQPRMLAMTALVLLGAHTREPDIRLFQMRRLSIAAEQALPVHTDGEVFGPYEADIRRLEIEIVPGAIRLIL